MYAPLLPAVATFGVASLLATVILARRDRSPIHWTYLALLVAILAWTGGVVWRFTFTDDAGLRHGLTLTYLGVHAAGPLWFLLAAGYTRSPFAEAHRGLKAVLFVPPALAWLAFVSNDHHHLFASEVSHVAMVAGPRSWGGPVFWMHLAWSYVFAAAGTALLLAHAWRLRGSREWRRGLQLAAAALAPILLSAVYVFRILPVPYDLTPTGLCITVLIFYVVLAREGLFETLPLARRDVIEELNDGVVLADPDGIVLDTNPAARRILALEGVSPVGRPLATLVPSAAVGESRDELARGLAALAAQDPGGRSPTRFQARFRTEQGRRVELAVAPVRSSSGRPAGIYALLRDCTEQHRYEQAIRQSQKLESVGVLAAGVAHEVNNPLAFIQANLGMLQQMADAVERNLALFPEKDARELADLRDVIDESLEGIARISRIVNRLRRFSRTAEEPVGPLDLNAVVEEAIRFARLDRHGGPAIEARLAPDLPRVHGSQDGLTQVMLNLLLNAAQAVAGRRDGRIEVTSRLEASEDADPPGWAVLEVRDNGPGVAESIRRHVFDPFFTTKAPDQGTGLGLAIAFDIAREHQGHLELLPDDGRGACFALRLPAAG